MKSIIKIIVLLFFISNYAQQSTDSNLTPFVGNWEWQNGNQTFKVQFTKGVDELVGYLEGDFELIEITGTGLNVTTTIIYKSHRLLNESINLYYVPAISGGSEDGILFTGSIEDNVEASDGIHSTKGGYLSFTIQTDTTATWIVESREGLYLDTTPQDFSIPTNITLTKVD
jgi:hypothetical protein